MFQYIEYVLSACLPEEFRARAGADETDTQFAACFEVPDTVANIDGIVQGAAQHWIKQGDYNRAIAYVDFEGMAEIVMAGYWDKMSPKDKNEITTFMKNLIREKFPVITRRLKLLKLGAVTGNGNQALCEALAVLDHTTENKDQKIQIGENITVTVVRVKGGAVRIGIEAPRGVKILRNELLSAPNSPQIADAADLRAAPRGGGGWPTNPRP